MRPLRSILTAAAVIAALAARGAGGQLMVGTTGAASLTEQYGTDPTNRLRRDVGQSFRVPANAGALIDFSVWTAATLANAGDFYARLYEFAPAIGPTGSPVYVSPAFAPPPSAATTVATVATRQTTFMPGPLILTPGAEYFLLLTSYTALGAFSPRIVYVDVIADAAAGGRAAGGYVDGSIWRSVPADRQLDPLALAYEPGDDDLRFEMRFAAAPSVVPEPPSLALLLAGLAGLAGLVAVGGSRAVRSLEHGDHDAA